MEPSGVSYRQVGKQSNGKVIRGFIAGQSRNPGSAKSSIPSKFETTLFTGNKERDGFGTRSHRFVVVENELPGPGSYHTETDARLHDGKIYSKKGLGGGFVSKAKRDSAFGKLSDAPAPGTYNHKGTIQTSDGRHFSGSTSAFKPPTQRCVTLSEEPEPGPGQYNAAQAVEVVRRHGELKNANSMFASQSARIQKGNSATRDLPAPGQYEPRVADYKYSDDLLPSSAFRSGVPTTGQKGAQRMTKEQQLGVVACVGGAGNPGPGQYNSARSSFLLSRRRSPQVRSRPHPHTHRCHCPGLLACCCWRPLADLSSSDAPLGSFARARSIDSARRTRALPLPRAPRPTSRPAPARITARRCARRHRSRRRRSCRARTPTRRSCATPSLAPPTTRRRSSSRSARTISTRCSGGCRRDESTLDTLDYFRSELRPSRRSGGTIRSLPLVECPPPDRADLARSSWVFPAFAFATMQLASLVLMLLSSASALVVSPLAAHASSSRVAASPYMACNGGKGGSGGMNPKLDKWRRGAFKKLVQAVSAAAAPIPPVSVPLSSLTTHADMPLAPSCHSRSRPRRSRPSCSRRRPSG